MKGKSRLLLGALAMCATGAHAVTESSQAVAVPQVQAAAASPSASRTRVAVGKFDNRSAYMRGIFSNGTDQLGEQAKTILVSHLQQTNRFSVLDRENMAEAKQEAAYQGKAQAIKGAQYVITGSVAEFGRKEVGDQQLFGILGRGKSQVAYAKVALNVVDVNSSEVVYSAQGAGEYELSSREIIGFGSTASYDSTLNGKVLDLAMREAINKLSAAIDSGAWTPGR
jgi:curli biogenesis system outer membrane secretion channel CsgG